MTSEKHFAAAALLISVFVAGIVGGAAFSSILQARSKPALGRPTGAGSLRGMIAPWFVMGDSAQEYRGFAPMVLNRRLSGELDLTEEQRGDLLKVLEGRQAQASSLMADLRPKLRAQLDSLQSEIRILLSPVQRELFDRFVEREEAFLRGRKEAIPGGRVPPRGLLQR
jgi:hypothetical protein